MQLKTWVGAGATLAMLLLSGCVPMTKVKDVLADKQAYMDANFSPDKLAREVVQTITAADQEPLGFHGMVFHLDWQLNDDDKNKTVSIEQTASFRNVGGSLVQMRVEDSRNGVPMTQNYQLSYRGIVALKSQNLNVGAAMTGFAFELKSFQHFDAVGRPSASGMLDYQYKSGTTAQIMNFRDGRSTCKIGPAYPAAKVNAQLLGDARDLDCTIYNSNGVKTSSSRAAYLAKYGVAVVLHTEHAAGISDAKVTSVEIE